MARRRPTIDLALALMGAALALALLAGCSGSGDSADATDFPDLSAGARVYDETGASLTDAEADEVQQRLDTLESDTGADVIVYIRELDADPEDTLDQVEALQQAWVAATDVDQDTAGAILINREPGADDEARAGIFLGTTYDDGNVPRDEQEAIVGEELVPPLRDGDVAGSLDAGIERLDSSIRNGPPTDALEDFADGPGSTWLPWLGLGLALLGTLGAALLFRGRATPTRPKARPTTARPDHDTSPALATALVHRGPQASSVPSAVLALATRDALAIEQEKEPGFASKGTAQLRLLDAGLVRGEVEQAVWDQLEEHAEDRVVDSKDLGKVSRDSKTVQKVVEGQLRERGWLAEGTTRPRVALVGLAVLAGLLMVGGIVVTSAGALLMLVTVIPAGALVGLAITTAAAYSRLSVAGRDAARPWEAYRDGLKEQGKDDQAQVDLDAVLPDIVALGLGSTFKNRLEAATDPETGTTLRAFTAPGAAGANAAIFPWGAFSGIFASSSGAGAGASGGGAGGGGGAAGST